jgi:putative membrane protein
MKEYLYNYFSGNISDADKEILFSRMEEDELLRQEFAALQNATAVSELLEKQGDDQLALSGLKNLKKTALKRKTRRISYQVMKYAAIVIILIGTWFLSQERTLDNFRKEYTWIEAPKGQRVFITLADGTSVWLNPSTRLKVPNVFDKNQRNVELEGEGFFKVTKNSDAPFTVKTRQYNVKVLGTEFNVFAYPDSHEFETELVRGSVYVYDKRQAQNGIYMKPNEKVRSVNGSLQKTSSYYNQQQLQEQGLYNMGDRPFGEILKRLELWYGVHFTVKRPDILKEVYSGKFRQSDNVIHILQAIQGVGKFHFRTISDKEIEIY